MFSTRFRYAAWITALVMVIAVGALAVVRERAAAAANQAVKQTLAIQQSINSTLSYLKDAETGSRGFLLTGDDIFLEPFHAAETFLPQELARLRRITSDDSAQIEEVRKIERLVALRVDVSRQGVALYRAGKGDEAVALVRHGTGKRLMDSLRAASGRMLLREEKVLQAREAAVARGRTELQGLIYAAAGLLLALSVGGVWSARRGMEESARTNSRLEESEKSFRALADNASDLVRLIGERGELLYVSPSCREILGFSEAEMLAMPAQALLHEDEAPAIRHLAEESRLGGPTPAQVHRLRGKDGRFRWFETKCSIVQHAEAGPVHLQLTSRDVDARRIAEDSLRRQTAHLQSVLSSIGDGVVVADESRTIRQVNPTASAYIRQTPGEQIGSDWVETHLARQLDGVTAYDPRQGPLSLALLGQDVDELGIVFSDRNGVDRAFSVTARPILDSSAIVGCVAIYRDVTDQRRSKQELEESEQRLRVLSEASFEGVAITKAAIILDANKNFAAWFGETPATLVGRSGLSLFAAEDRELVRAAGGSAGFYEAHMVRPDGSQFPVEVRVRDATFRGEPVRISAVRDVTEKRKREEELRAQAELLRELSLKDELTGLYNRRGFTELAQQELRVCGRAKRSASVMFIDLNGMKTINDSLGHEMGDRALVATAELLRTAFREADILSRLGGDEFAVLAVDCSEEDAILVQQRLLRRAEAFNDGREPFTLRMSVGSATFAAQDGASRVKPDLAALMDEADQAMYAAKRALKMAESERRSTRTGGV